MKIYLNDKYALAFYQQQASADFWDHHWEIDDLRSVIVSCTSDGLFLPLVKKYLPQGSMVLEGGCGRGQLVHALYYQKYRVIGIDFAEKTVRRIHEAVPELDVRIGDVRHLPIENNTLDGYLSAGVIEHFWGGYHPIFAEMSRTLKLGGFLFVSFPYVSLLRRFKIALRAYPIRYSHDMEADQGTFYQFALRWQHVVQDLEQFGFQLREACPYDGIKGFKDEFTWFKPLLQPIYDGKTFQQYRPILDKWFKPFAAHCMLLVMQKIRNT